MEHAVEMGYGPPKKSIDDSPYNSKSSKCTKTYQLQWFFGNSNIKGSVKNVLEF